MRAVLVSVVIGCMFAGTGAAENDPPVLKYFVEVGVPSLDIARDLAYWGTGPITAAPGWTNAACAVDNTGEATFDPGDPAPGTFFYFVIVGQTATKEASYGTGASGERPEAIGIGVCDKPQDLSGSGP